jgi:aminopeptidase
MADPRLTEYARLLVNRCIDVQPGWQVIVRSTPAARPLVDEIVAAIAARGAYALPRLTFRRASPWTAEAPLELLGTMPSIEAYELDHADTFIVVDAPKNTREGSDISAERLMLRRQATRPHTEPYFAGKKPWVGCQFPTPALAQDAGMGVREYAEFLYGAVLVDWDALGERMRQIGDRFDGAETVRVTGDGTDVTFSLAGRHGRVDAVGANMPGGEVFYSPVETSAEGVITYSEYPACYGGRTVERVRLAFEGGRVVDASSATDEDFLITTLDTDEGARVLGEFGIGCNPGIQRHTKNTLFDEKIDGTALRGRQRLRLPRRHERQRRALGHGQEPARQRPHRGRRRDGPGERDMADLADPRIEAYAKLIVERCLDVQPGWQVLVRSTPLARPLLDELERQIAKRGAHAIMRINWNLWPTDWLGRRRPEARCRDGEVDRFACGDGRADHARCSREHAREGEPAARALGADTGCGAAVLRADDGVGDPLGQLPVSNRCARAGGGSHPGAAHRHRVRLLPARLGR